MQTHRYAMSVAKCTGAKPLMLGLVLALVSALSSCGILGRSGSDAENNRLLPLNQQPYSLSLRLLASSDLNLDSQSRPTPVKVRVFAMQPQVEVASIGFKELFEYGDYIMTPQPLAAVVLQPGQVTDLALQPNKEQTMIVVAAAYRHPYDSIWRAIVEIEPFDEVSASATIGATTVTILLNP